MTTLMTNDQFTDVEFENDVEEVAEYVANVRANPTALPSYEEATAAIRKAKLLLFNLRRDCSTNIAGSRRLLNLAEETVSIAERSRQAIPRKLVKEFTYILNGLRRHVRTLREPVQARPQ